LGKTTESDGVIAGFVLCRPPFFAPTDSQDTRGGFQTRPAWAEGIFSGSMRQGSSSVGATHASPPPMTSDLFA